MISGVHHFISLWEHGSRPNSLLTYYEHARLSQFCCTFDATILCCMTLESSLCQNKFENTHLWDINWLFRTSRKLVRVSDCPRLPGRGLTESFGLARPFRSVQIDKPTLIAKLSSIQQFGWTFVKHIISEETILLRIQNLLWTIFWSFITFWCSLSYQLNFALKNHVANLGANLEHLFQLIFRWFCVDFIIWIFARIKNGHFRPVSLSNKSGQTWS